MININRQAISLQERKNKKIVGYWLLVGVGMLVIQILLGGITRLTGSGLSITEWNIVTGTMPPLNESQWIMQFEKYKATPQYRLLNAGFGLGDFKFIFFWEWLHRLWARLLGVVFAVGFIYFLITKKFRAEMVRPLIILFLLGALQGAVGWIMVASGLTGDAMYVKPTKLALHFIFAMGLLCYTFWFALKVLVNENERQAVPSVLSLQAGILFLLVFQLLYGALMAGHKAATVAPTWPDINGSFFSPPGLYDPQRGLLNFIENKIMVHYIHRGLAYLLLLLTIILSFRIHKLTSVSLVQKIKWLPLFVILLQALLGITVVITSVSIIPGHWGKFEWLAQLHQLMGMSYLLVMIMLLYLTTGGKKAAIA